MVYKRVRGWTSGRSLPVLNFIKNPPFPLPPGIRPENGTFRKRSSGGSGEPRDCPVRARDLLKPDMKWPVSVAVLNSSDVIRTSDWAELTFLRQWLKKRAPG